MTKDNSHVVLDVMQSPSAKIMLSTGLSINGDTEIVILNFLQFTADADSNYMHVVSRVAVTPTHLKAYIKMMQDALDKMEEAKKTAGKE